MVRSDQLCWGNLFCWVKSGILARLLEKFVWHNHGLILLQVQIEKRMVGVICTCPSLSIMTHRLLTPVSLLGRLRVYILVLHGEIKRGRRSFPRRFHTQFLGLGHLVCGDVMIPMSIMAIVVLSTTILGFM